MMSCTRFLSVFAFLCVVAFTGCQKKVTEEIDFGTVVDSVYSNQYFGFSAKIPEGWYLQDDEARKALSAMGENLLAGDDQSLKAAIRIADMRSVNLFMVFQHELGAPVSFNPNILCVAERVGDLPGIKDGAGYLFHSRKLLESSAMEVAFPGEVTVENLGGKDFHVMNTELTVGGVVVKQRYYALVMKGYALGLITSASSEEEGALLADVLATVDFAGE